MQWLILSLALTCGYMPQNVQMLDQALYDKPCFEQTVEVSGLVAEHLNVFGSVQTYDTHNKGLSFFPFRADYSIGAELLWKGFALGVRHECDHPVIYTSPQALGYAGNETEIYLSYNGSWNIF